MAIYAFDGTGNKDNPGDGKDTNVLKFFNAYKQGYDGEGECFYIEGVGVEDSLLDKAKGSVAGAGGHDRVKDALNALTRNFGKGDKRIDIVGFSRGAALALEFANEINDIGIAGEDKPEINFLGLWDTVASFGVPGNNINLGYMLTVPTNVQHCFHALALDERRFSFPLTRLVQDRYSNRGSLDVNEVWFRGFHSDVGGGNENQALSSIPLVWMFERAKDHGINIPGKLLEQHRNLRNPDAECHKPKLDQVPYKKRTIQHFDFVHDSVFWRKWASKPLFKANNPPKGLRIVNDSGDILLKQFGER